jgi:hypothetical protein
LLICWRPADYSDPFEECPCEFKLRIDVAIDHAKNGQLPLTSFEKGFTLPSPKDAGPLHKKRSAKAAMYVETGKH